MVVRTGSSNRQHLQSASRTGCRKADLRGSAVCDMGGESYRDGIDIKDPELFRRLAATSEIPKTSQVCPPDFATLFEQARTDGADEIVCVTVSGDLSGTYASAVQARDMVDFPVHVVDTRQVSWGLGFAALAAARARDAGATPNEIVQAVRDAAAHTQLIFTIESLEYLHRGGRIGNASRLLGSALNIKPVLELKTVSWQRWIKSAPVNGLWRACSRLQNAGRVDAQFIVWR